MSLNHDPETCAVCAPELAAVHKDQLIWGEGYADASGSHIRRVPTREWAAWKGETVDEDPSRCS